MSKFAMYLLVAILLTACSFAAPPKHYVFGLTWDVWPLMTYSGEIIQWNVDTYGGALVKGSYDSGKYGGICNTNTPHCFGSDGRGNWRFLFTGTDFCTNTCTYTATGDIVVGKRIKLPDGSTTVPFSAVLCGTFVGNNGVAVENVIAYYESFTAPAVDGVNELAPGGLTIVLQDN